MDFLSPGERFQQPLVPGNQDWGESKSITSERGNFLLKPTAPGDIIHVRALAAAGGRVLPQDRKESSGTRAGAPQCLHPPIWRREDMLET